MTIERLKLYLFNCLAVLMMSCHSGETEPVGEIVKRDTSITRMNAFTNLALDSLSVEAFLVESAISDTIGQQIRNFYNGRNYQFAWFTEEGVSEQAQFFWNLVNEHLHLTKDSSFYNEVLHKKVDSLLQDESESYPDRATTGDIELQTTLQFFRFAKPAYTGSISPKELQWHIPRKKIDAVSLLDSLIKMQGGNLNDWEPVNEQFHLLKQQLVRLYKIAQGNKWSPILPEKNKSLRKGDSAAVVVAIKHRLRLMGDYHTSDESPLYDEQLVSAIKRMQRRFGLRTDGICGPRVLRALNVPPEQRIQQVLINMERIRWLPHPPEGRRILVNIPEFKLHVYEDDEEVLAMDIVVGKAATRTVIFSEELKYIVFSPYWNLPSSIVKNEILPAMKSRPGYLSAHNMEITGQRNGIPVIRQKPGANNSLGKVKFMFPNKYNIYLHDTPAKSLFQQNKRAFSHGCIRVRRPFELAAYLLKDNRAWTKQKIREKSNRSTESWVALSAPVPVLITYFTSWVDSEGSLHFREDIYGHDRRMENRLFFHESEKLAHRPQQSL